MSQSSTNLDDASVLLAPILESICEDRQLPRPTVFWCPSAIDAFYRATLAVLEGEMRRVLMEHEDWDFDVENVDRAITALACDSSEGVERADLIEGMFAIFTLGGLYRSEPQDQPLFRALESSLSEKDLVSNFEARQLYPDTLVQTYEGLDAALDAQVESLIFAQVNRLCEPDSNARVSLYESLVDQLAEVANHIERLGPSDFANRELESRLGIWWLFSYSNSLWLAGAPEELHLDEQGLLHRADGPALVFSDAVSNCYWKGELVPASWIMGELTRRDIELVEQYAAEYPEIAPHRAPEVLADILRSRKGADHFEGGES